MKVLRSYKVYPLWLISEFLIIENLLRNFFTDAFVDYYVNHPDYQVTDGWTYATIAVTHSGHIRTSLSPGKVIFDDLFTILPFAFTIDTFELRGEHLLEMLEYGASAYRTYNFLQFSGMHVVLNVTKPNNEKVISVDVLCRECQIPKYEPLDLTKWYRIIFPSFVGAGGNGFEMLKTRRNVRTGNLDTTAAEAYMKKLGPIIQKKDGRLTVLK